jgi:uridine kinase
MISRKKIASNVSCSKRRLPVFVAIVGGSASGKTWLSQKLGTALGGNVAHLSLDSFYRDRSHLSPARRVRVNFDKPSAIDWPEFNRVLRNCIKGRTTQVPVYDFKTHTRLKRTEKVKAEHIFLVDGLWLLRRPSIRSFFNFTIFLECPVASRLHRRLNRDRLLRGRSNDSVQEQFWNTVEPMHKKYVTPQRKRADLVLTGNWGEREISAIVEKLRLLGS